MVCVLTISAWPGVKKWLRLLGAAPCQGRRCYCRCGWCGCSVFLAAVLVRFLTRRFIGEYASNSSKWPHTLGGSNTAHLQPEQLDLAVKPNKRRRARLINTSQPLKTTTRNRTNDTINTFSVWTYHRKRRGLVATNRKLATVRPTRRLLCSVHWGEIFGGGSEIDR